MIQAYFNNFAVLTLAVLIGGWYMRDSSSFRRKLAMGAGGGLIGILLMLFTVHAGGAVILDARHMGIIIAAYFGGVPAALVSAGLVAGFRILHFGYSSASAGGALNAFGMAIAASWMVRRFASFRLNWLLMCFASLVLVSATVAVLLPSLLEDVLPAYALFILFCGLYSMAVVEMQNKASDEHRIRETLVRLSRSYHHSERVADVYAATMSELLELFHAEFGSVYVVHHGRSQLVLRASNGRYTEHKEFDDGTLSPSFEAVMKGEARIYSDWSHQRPDSEAAEQLYARGLRSSIHVPVYHEGKVVAFLNLGARKRARFTRKDLKLIDFLNPLIGMGIAQTEANAKFTLLSDATGDAVIMCDEEGTITHWNRGATVMFGSAAEAVLGKPLFVIIPERYRQAQGDGLRRYLESGSSDIMDRTTELTGVRSDGTEFPIELTLNRGEKAGDIHYVGIIRDISERKSAQEDMLALKQELSDTLHLQHGITFKFVKTGDTYTYTFGDGQLLYKLGLTPETFQGKTVAEIVPASMVAYTHGIYDRAWAGETLEYESGFNGYTYLNILKPIWNKIGRITEVLVSGTDITARKQAERELQKANRVLSQMANRDGLTGLFNRRHFDGKLEAEWDRSCRESRPVSVILCDIDYFKAYNDTYGHLGGDECLKQVASLLQAGAVRAGGVAARYGGEEFVLLLPDTGPDVASEAAKQILSEVNGRAISHESSAVCGHLTVSMGVSSSVPKAGMTCRELIDQADKALYRAKLEGRNRVVIESL